MSLMTTDAEQPNFLVLCASGQDLTKARAVLFNYMLLTCCHVMYAFQSNLHSIACCLNVKELLARNMCYISLSGSKFTHLPKLGKWVNWVN